nr:MAG TPA: hypothetical protein [Caudoviricetes sp.]
MSRGYFRLIQRDLETQMISYTREYKDCSVWA